MEDVDLSTSFFRRDYMIGRFETFSFALENLSSSWSKIATEELKPFGLKGAYVLYLIALYKHDEGLTSANLCELCNKDKADVSRGIKALESKGLVVREDVAGNGYRAKITLTEQGKKTTMALRERIKLAVERGGYGLSDEQRENFYAALEIIAANLKEMSKGGL